MIFVPLLHYFLCKNDYSGNEAGLRYRLTPGKRTVPDPAGGADATKEEKILTVDYWPAPWTIDKTDPALRRREVFPLTDEGRAAAAQFVVAAATVDADVIEDARLLEDAELMQGIAAVHAFPHHLTERAHVADVCRRVHELGEVQKRR